MLTRQDLVVNITKTIILAGGKCVGMDILVPSIVLPAMAALFVLVYAYIIYEHRKADSLWVVSANVTVLIFQ